MRQILLIFSLISTINSISQNLKINTIIEERSYYLNGGTRATLVGGKSRETIKIDLPENTKYCYYSFTTKPGHDGTQLLNLGTQITAALYGGTIGSSIASSIIIPEGSGSADVFILPITSKVPFLNKQDKTWKFYQDISLQNAKQAVQYIDNNEHGNSFYIGLRNPSGIAGVEIKIEVVAVVENIDTEKGVMYGNLGWKAYEKGDYLKCIELSNKALEYDSHLSYVKFNIALSNLVLGKKECIDNYIDAISSCKSDRNPKETLEGALNDILSLKKLNLNLNNLNEVEELVRNENLRYQ